MKRILMFAAMVTVIIAAVGCDPDEGPGKDPVLQSFEVAVDAVTKTSVTYSVTPAVLDKEYIAVVKTAESVEGVEDEALVEGIFSDFKTVAAQSGLTLSEYMAKNVVKGVTSGATVNGLAVDTDYVLVVFGVDPAADYTASTYPFTTDFSTAAVVKSDCTFDVVSEVNMNTVDFDVTPSDAGISWHLFTIMKSSYDAYLDPAGDYRWDKATFYQAYVENETAQYLGAGYSAEEALAAMFVKGNATLHAEGLNVNTEYAWLVAGFEIEDGVPYLVTDVAEGTYMTGNVAKSDLTFDISVTDVEQMKAAIKITPSDNDAKFCWMVQEYDGVQTPEDVMNGIVSANQMWFDMGFMLYNGVQDYTGGAGSPYKYSLDMPDTDYCVIAFGYSGGVNTDPEMVTFKTLPGGAPEDCTFSAEITKTTPYAVEFNLVPSDVTVYYTADVCLASEFDKDALVAEVENGIQQTVEMQQMWNPNTTVAQVISMYYWSGANVMNANGLQPETEYMLYVCAIDAKTGKVASVTTVDPFVTTSALGSVTPSIELIGYYSGDDEAGNIFGDAAATAGKSIAVVKYSASADATAIYSTISTGNALSVEDYTDAYLMSYISSYYWSAMDMSQPYSFFVLSWEEDNTVLAYAEDASGNLGAIARTLLRATAEAKGDVADLKALVDELNAQDKGTAGAAPLSKGASSRPAVTLKEKLSVAPVESADVCEAPQSFAAPKPALESGRMLMLDRISASWMRR